TLPAGRFHLCEWGDPPDPPLLLLHGFNQTGHSWSEIGPLVDGHHVVALTQRGHGDSMRSTDHDYRREVMVGDVSSLVDHFGWERVDVVGMSMGGVHAIGFAASAPERTRTLCVVDYAPETKREGVDKIKAILMARWSSFDEAVAQVRLFNPRRTEENIRSRLTSTIEEKEDGSWSWKVDLAFADQARFSDPSTTMWDLASRVACPALVIRGSESDVLSEKNAERLRDTFARGSLVTIEGAGHSVPGDRPRAFAAALAEHLATG
ncbi:MAG: alpha/beta hydrolase, partial [Polyangiaceae bacterium]